MVWFRNFLPRFWVSIPDSPAEPKPIHVGYAQMRVSSVENQLQTTGTQWYVHLTIDSGNTYTVNVAQDIALRLHNGESVEVEIVLPAKSYLKVV